MAGIDLTRSEHHMLANRLSADLRIVQGLREDAEKLRARAKTAAVDCGFLDFEASGGALERFENECNAAATRIGRRIEQHKALEAGRCPECDGDLVKDRCADGCRYD